ncbi:tetratricopeptide repeat protein [Leptolyngbya sp. FACHB-36]|uniref:tetratricopeptide repeat protein n=1 Tax=Leptolyngbya sp. FACHB-36 TaxID=2692808 RepID=UPI0016818397|nr:tetratricopeptide repeat protein [Leptolyngbya sp. FACHB-36]MBD2019771.1 tetratricopeptide repeat protein [Leptolyngbya sp. FACHB-36]
MADSSSLYDRYVDLIDQIIQSTLKGNIRSKEQVYRLLVDGVQVGTGELFERSLHDRLTHLQQQADTETNEFRQAKATRSLRALQTIQGEWTRWQTQNQASAAISATAQHLIVVDPAQRLAVFVQAIDPNRAPMSAAQLKSLAAMLQQSAALSSDCDLQEDVQQLVEGITHGLESSSRLQDHLVSWIYEQEQLGFGGIAGQRNPWTTWAKQLSNPLLVNLFQTLSLNRSPVEFIEQQPTIDVATWVELALVLHSLQQGLVAWFDQHVYDSKMGTKLSISSFLMFAIVWSQLARGFEQATQLNSFHRDRFAGSAFQITLQILRVFSQRSYFPLYGGVYASFPGSQLRSVVDYLNEPLKRADATQEKARILTLIGSSERAQGQLDRAIEFHNIARELAAEAEDRPCEIANLNHLSRTYAMQKRYAEAVAYSQRALILSRQTGDRQGEANALVNLGYGEVLQAHQREQADPDAYEFAIGYLQQGVTLADDLGDYQSQAFGFNSLGIAHLVLDQPQPAATYLVEALKAAQMAGDLYLQGIDLAYLAEAYYRLQSLPEAIHAGCLGMYYLDAIASREWQQPAGLLTVLRGQMGDAFQTTLETLRRQLIAAIGVDGYDHLPTLLDRYRNPDRDDV